MSGLVANQIELYMTIGFQYSYAASRGMIYGDCPDSGQ